MNEQDLHRWSARKYRPNHVNGEPNVMLGNTAKEIVGVAIACLAVCLVAAVLLGQLVGKTRVLISLAVIVAFVAMFVVGQLVARAKRGKLPGHAAQKLHLFLARIGFSPPQLLLADGPLEQRRSRQRVAPRRAEAFEEVYFEDDDDD